jgi:signal transduction histidine kinase
MSIAQAIVAAHGGRVWVQDNPDGGTTVSFGLPLLVPE